MNLTFTYPFPLLIFLASPHPNPPLTFLLAVHFAAVIPPLNVWKSVTVRSEVVRSEWEWGAARQDYLEQ